MKKVNSTDLINWWLDKFHNTSLEKAKLDHPEWREAEIAATKMRKSITNYTEEQRDEISSRLSNATREFYRIYAVTQEQYEEWKVWAKAYIKKESRCSKKLLEYEWPWIDLQTSPSVVMTNTQEQDEKT